MELTIFDILKEELIEVEKEIFKSRCRQDSLIKQIQEICTHPESSMMDSGNCGLCGRKDVDQL